MELHPEFLIEVLYAYCKRPFHKKYQNIFNAECPICKEGKSAGRSRRLFYFPNKQYFYCHNCARSWKPFEWVKEVSGLTVPEILKKNKQKTEQQVKTKVVSPQEQVKTLVVPDLPENSIDLTDEYQFDYFKSNHYVKIAKQYCEYRRLFTAINTCKKFYISLEDSVHKNRLVIPFLGNNNKIVSYQTRALLENQHPKYLTKYGEKELFNFANIESEIPYVFVLEGPIDSMFIKNGVAMASLAPTQKQLQQINSLIGYQIIYVFDNDSNNKHVFKKIEKTIKAGKTVFLWPKELEKFKDFNEMGCRLKIDEIPWKFVVKHSFEGAEALLKLKLQSI